MYVDTRVSRRTNQSRVRGAHDYQRIAVPFAGGGVAFVSDQGIFIKPAGDSLQLIAANGDLSNNIALQVAVSEGDGPGKNYLVTTAWDWAPLASWDSGAHWGSWETKDDGASAGWRRRPCVAPASQQKGFVVRPLHPNCSQKIREMNEKGLACGSRIQTHIGKTYPANRRF